MQKSITNSVNSKQEMLAKIIKNLTVADDVNVNISVGEIMSEIPMQTIEIRIRKNAEIIPRHRYFDSFEW